MRRFRLLTGASVVALVVLSACGGGGGAAAPTSAPAPTTAPAKPAAASPAAASPAASPSAAAAASPSPAAKPAASPAASPSAAAAASPSAVAAGGPKPTVKMGSANFPEQVILGELYSQILEANGYTIERHLNLGTREIVEPALESGQIDMYPEYLATVTTFLTKDQTKASSDPAATARALQDAFTPKNITVLAYSPAQDENGFVVTQDTAKKYNLSKMSDLQPVANQLVLGATPECPQRPFCLIGLQQTYGLNFKDFRPLDTGGPLTVQALLGGQIDIGLLFTTDANITLNNFVLLDDDKHLQLADNVAPVIRNDILNRASDLRTLADRVSQTLTTADLTDLNKQVSIDHRDAKDAAADYLKSKNLVSR
jgi:osmoprotectant transport system substrate-binding protein